MELGEEERYAAAALFSLALHLTLVLPHRACCSASPGVFMVLVARTATPVPLEVSSEQFAGVCNSVCRSQYGARSTGYACRYSTGRRRGSTTYLARQLGGALLERQAHAFASSPVSCIAPAPATSLCVPRCDHNVRPALFQVR